MTEPSTTLRNLRLPIRFCITLKIYPGSLQPNQVSSLLGMDATSAVSREPMGEPLGSYAFRMGKHNGWFLESEKRVESRDPRAHFDWFLRQVSPLRTKIADVLKGPDCKAYIDVIAWSEDGGLDYVISPDDLSCLASLEIPVCFSFANYPQDEKL
jgi:hypothetical protein